MSRDEMLGHDGSPGETTAAPTYVLHAEPGHVTIGGATAELSVHPDLAGAMLQLTLKEVGKRKRMDSEERADVDQTRQDLESGLVALRKIDGLTMREAALGAVVAALKLGFHHRGGPTIARELEAEFSANQTAAALAGRRIDAVRDIIKQHATTLWVSDPDLKGNASSTARAIVEHVARDVQKLSKIPQAWKAQIPLSGKPLEHYTENVRKHISKISISDH